MLLRRGLIISDHDCVLRHLQFVTYYRLMGYGRVFFEPGHEDHRFRPGSTYEQVWNIYKFDRKLRLLTMDAVERIEVAVRSALSDYMSRIHGAHWFLNSSLFNDRVRHAELLLKIKQETGHSQPTRRTEYCQHYYNKYSAPELPPSWMTMEALSLGQVSQCISNMRRSEQKSVALAFGFNDAILVSWIGSLAFARNVCAHHGILWNKQNKRPPKFPDHALRDDLPDFRSVGARYFALAVVIKHFLSRIVRKSTWPTRLNSLFEEHPGIPMEQMGFPPRWAEAQFWEIKRPEVELPLLNRTPCGC